MHPTKVTVILAELQEQGFCEKRLAGKRQCYERLPREGSPDLSRYERQLEVRTRELESMFDYARDGELCAMATLRSALGDAEVASCGQCDRCEQRDSVATDAPVVPALEWLSRRPVVLPAARRPAIADGAK